MVKQQPVGAHYGTRDWLMQRVTAIVMAVYAVILPISAYTCGANYGSWSALFSSQWMKLATFTALIALFLHAWVGMREILMDYIKPVGLRLFFQALVIVALVAYTAWAIQILWGMK